MKVCILMGSPRKQGNTNALLGPFRQELEGLGAETETVWLHALEIRPCTACRACQRDWTAFGCAQRVWAAWGSGRSPRTMGES